MGPACLIAVDKKGLPSSTVQAENAVFGKPAQHSSRFQADFNDLATKSALVRKGVERQVKVEVGRMIREADEKRERIQEQEKKHVQEQRPRRAARIA